MHYVTSHYAPSPRDGTFPVMLPAQLMFRVTIPTILYSRNKDFVCRNGGTLGYRPGSFLSCLQEVAHNLEGERAETWGGNDDLRKHIVLCFEGNISFSTAILNLSFLYQPLFKRKLFLRL